MWHRRGERDYWCCHQCQLVSVPVQQRISAADEKAEYDRHENTLDDAGYRRFLSRTFNALVERLPPGSTGLDFGCGPGPALAAMFEEAGFPVALYDLFYRPDSDVLQRRYDFITLTEVIEHLGSPWEVLSMLWQQLHPGGKLAIQTQPVRDQAAFRQWRYIHDPTHIAFYAPATFEWLARRLGAERLETVAADVVILHKPGHLADRPR
ncbi:class I SAM-dependent methyltransferase [Saccharospirillum mangrovi]|uniref:class I SAM-dependent methyltransferase n=1 Tax=Saccharospirillum mangrovi TaxID=2161747 RepID=UPI001E595F1D|nr:class I SAM-dependent methyltransferase [Saccharospirillum mangrovi]